MLVKRKSQCITRSIWFTLYWGSQVSNTGNVQERFANIKMHWSFGIQVIKKDNFCKLIDQFKSFASLLLVGFGLDNTFLGGEEHSSYLSFVLHTQNFWRIKLTHIYIYINNTPLCNTKVCIVIHVVYKIIHCVLLHCIHCVVLLRGFITQ